MKKAFTLAEVLLVLAIIGVIAALTVPNLVTSNMDKKYVALAKKAQTTLQQAIDTKMGDAALGTNRMNMHLLRWLANTQGNVPGVLRVSNSNPTNANFTSILTTDGILYRTITEANSCTNDDPCYIAVDLDGAGGITNSEVGNTEVVDGADDITARDVVVFECRRNFIAPANPEEVDGGFEQGAIRANEYLGFSVNN